MAPRLRGLKRKGTGPVGFVSFRGPVPFLLGPLTCFLMLALAQPALAQTRLEWKFADGDSFVLERIYTQKQVIDVNGKTYTQETTSKWLTTVAVSEKNARTALLLLTIDGVSIKTNGPWREPTGRRPPRTKIWNRRRIS